MTPHPQPDYTFVPTGFPPAPVTDGVRWYYLPYGEIVKPGDTLIRRTDGAKIATVETGGWGNFPNEFDAIIRRIPAEPVATPDYKGPFVWHAVPEEETYVGVCKSCGGRWAGGKHSTVCEACYIRSKATPDYPAGLPPGLVKVDPESDELIPTTDYMIDIDGNVHAPSTCARKHEGVTVRYFCSFGGKSAVYRAAPDALPPADHSGDANETVHAPTCPTHLDNMIGCECDHLREPTKMVGGWVIQAWSKSGGYFGTLNFTGSESVAIFESYEEAEKEVERRGFEDGDGSEFVAKIVRATKPTVPLTVERSVELLADIAVEKVRLTAENTRLAGELENLKETLAMLEMNTPKIRELESELARLKSPVDVEEFKGITLWLRDGCTVYALKADGTNAWSALVQGDGAEAVAGLMVAAPRLLRELVEARKRAKDNDDAIAAAIPNLEAIIRQRDAAINAILRSGLIVIEKVTQREEMEALCNAVKEGEVLELREYKADIERQREMVLADKCPTDERHCPCVDVLRARVRELETPTGWWSFGEPIEGTPEEYVKEYGGGGRNKPDKFVGYRVVCERWLVDDYNEEKDESVIRLATPEEIAAAKGGKP